MKSVDDDIIERRLTIYEVLGNDRLNTRQMLAELKSRCPHGVSADDLLKDMEWMREIGLPSLKQAHRDIGRIE